LEELESYAKQVDEFKTYGDMSDIPKYLKKAQTLDNKLQAASEKVIVLLTRIEIVHEV
jgi:dynein heavy chain, axonemal